MHDFDATRIFWKEWRAQRSFWIGLFALATGLEFLVIVVTPLWRHVNPIDQLRIYQSMVIVLACSFATGSVAIAFAGEVEATTQGLLQRIPVRTRDLMAGKLSFSLLGSYALLVALWLIGGLMLLIDTQTSVSRLVSPDVSREIRYFLQSLLTPIVFVAVGGLFSLILSDVLLTVVIAGLTTAGLLAVPEIRDHLTLQGALILAVGICDIFLARRWLHASRGFEWNFVPRVTFPQFARRSRAIEADSFAALESRRSAVAWRRAAGSLIWKEFRQAFPFCLALLVAGLVALGLIKLLERPYWGKGGGFILVSLIAFAPLLPGVAAMRADRKAGAFHLLAHRGVGIDGFLICKHLVWLALSLSVFGIVLIVDRCFLTDVSRAHLGEAPTLWKYAAETANATFESPETSVTAPLFAAAIHVVLLYALGFLLALVLPGPVVALFGGALLWLALVFCWVLVAHLRIPFWWTIGLFPLILLGAAWLRTSDWMVGRNTASAWAKVAAALVVPFVGIVAATAVYRMTEIPAVSIPKEVLEPALESAAGPASVAKRSMFVDAMDALTGGPPAYVAPLDDTVFIDGWKSASRIERDWVEANSRALKLALEAAKREPGVFPAQSVWGKDRATPTTVNKVLWLCDLLLYSARKFESDARLDDALSCYIAIARLGRDAARSDQTSARLFGDGFSMMALRWMQRWAVSPQQSTERIKKAIHEFESFEMRPATPSIAVMRDWQVDRRILREALWGHLPIDKNRQTVSELWWVRWIIPWELVRLERLTDAVYASNLEEADEISSDLLKDGFVTMTAARAARWGVDQDSLRKYDRTTLDLPDLVQLTYLGPQNDVDRLALERMYLIALAIADFNREHHKLPDSLRALVPGYFERVPVDPWMGDEFVYEPQGLIVDIDTRNGKVAPKTPFLASVGLWDSHVVSRWLRRQSYSFEIVSRFAPSGEPKKSAGLIFPGPVVPLTVTSDKTPITNLQTRR